MFAENAAEQATANRRVKTPYMARTRNYTIVFLMSRHTPVTSKINNTSNWIYCARCWSIWSAIWAAPAAARIFASRQKAIMNLGNRAISGRSYCKKN
jgi:hypothetical protein